VRGQPDIRLLLADVDGTLVTQDKVLTEATKEAARELRDAGIALAITSGRRGMSMLIKPLALRGAIAGQRRQCPPSQRRSASMFGAPVIGAPSSSRASNY
jgi:haloacid dehalogenase-like hydrolase